MEFLQHFLVSPNGIPVAQINRNCPYMDTVQGFL